MYTSLNLLYEDIIKFIIRGFTFKNIIIIILLRYRISITYFIEKRDK